MAVGEMLSWKRARKLIPSSPSTPSPNGLAPSRWTATTTPEASALPDSDFSRISNVGECSPSNGFHNYLAARLCIYPCFGGKLRCYGDEGRSRIEDEIAANAVQKHSKQVDVGLSRGRNACCRRGVTGVAVSFVRVFGDYLWLSEESVGLQGQMKCTFPLA